MMPIKPVKRSKIRIKIGKLFYTYKRYGEWYLSDKRYSKSIDERPLAVVAFKHKTPLYRQLRDVDMWMQYNKVVNLKIAAQKLNGIIVKPGEAFSYWKTLGKPTKRKGYVEGMVLFYGGFQAGIGGGLCQLSNLLYWMTLHTPLSVIERYRHSYDVFPDVNRTQPFGTGATCVYNYRDLQIYNGTNQVYQLQVYLNDQYLIGEWRTIEKPIYTYEVYEKEHRITHEYWGGYMRHNRIYRKVFDIDHNMVGDEYIAENHALMMYQPFLESSM
ncbi:VanW family protein [Clostridiaceae bacterium 35-E11]